MIYYDGIIYGLQASGGITVMFNELTRRFQRSRYILEKPKSWIGIQRYLPVVLHEEYELFHSTYYRIPFDRKIPVVTTVHDFTYERFSSGIKRWVHTFQKSIAIKRADLIICVSQNTKADLLKFCGRRYERKIRVIYNGVSHDYKELNDVKRERQVLFVGNRIGYKNIELVIGALARIPMLELICVGGGKFTKPELDLLNKLIPGRYKHLGALSNAQLNIEYNKSICFAYPSLYEGFGIPVLEAMSAGCPVIAARSSSIPEVAGEAAFLMNNNTVDEMEAGIRLCMEPIHSARFRVLGLDRAKLFSWDQTFLQTVAVYSELLGYDILERL